MSKKPLPSGGARVVKMGGLPKAASFAVQRSVWNFWAVGHVAMSLVLIIPLPKAGSTDTSFVETSLAVNLTVRYLRSTCVQ